MPYHITGVVREAPVKNNAAPGLRLKAEVVPIVFPQEGCRFGHISVQAEGSDSLFPQGCPECFRNALLNLSEEGLKMQPHRILLVHEKEILPAGEVEAMQILLSRKILRDTDVPGVEHTKWYERWSG
jgi:hypothetical protein